MALSVEVQDLVAWQDDYHQPQNRDDGSDETICKRTSNSEERLGIEESETCLDSAASTSRYLECGKYAERKDMSFNIEKINSDSHFYQFDKIQGGYSNNFCCSGAEAKCEMKNDTQSRSCDTNSYCKFFGNQDSQNSGTVSNNESSLMKQHQEFEDRFANLFQTQMPAPMERTATVIKNISAHSQKKLVLGASKTSLASSICLDKVVHDETERNEFPWMSSTKRKFISATSLVNLPGNFAQTAPGNLQGPQKQACYLQEITLGDGTSTVPCFESTGSFQPSRCFVSQPQITDRLNYISIPGITTSLSSTTFSSTLSTFASSLESSSAFTSTLESSSAFVTSVTGSFTFSCTSSFSSSNSFPSMSSRVDCPSDSLHMATIASERLSTPPKIYPNFSKPPIKDNITMNQNYTLATIQPRGLQKSRNSLTSIETQKDAGDGCRLETRNRSASTGDTVESVPSRRKSPVGAEDPENNVTQPWAQSRRQKISYRLKGRNVNSKSKHCDKNSSAANKKSVRKLLSSRRNRADSDSDTDNAWITGGSGTGSDSESEDRLFPRTQLKNNLYKFHSDTMLNIVRSETSAQFKPVCKQVISQKKFLQNQVPSSTEIKNEDVRGSNIHQKTRNDENNIQDARVKELKMESKFVEAPKYENIKCSGKPRTNNSIEEFPEKKCSTNEDNASNHSLFSKHENIEANIVESTENRFVLDEHERKSESDKEQPHEFKLPYARSRSSTLGKLSDKKLIPRTQKNLTTPSACTSSNQTTADVQMKYISPLSGTSVRDLIKKFSSMDNLNLTDNTNASQAFRKDIELKSKLQNARNYEMRKVSLDPEKISQPKTSVLKSVSCDDRRLVNNNISIDGKTSHSDPRICHSSQSSVVRTSQTPQADAACKLTVSKSDENAGSNFPYSSKNTKYQTHIVAPIAGEKKNLGAIVGPNPKPEFVGILHTSQMLDHSSQSSMPLLIHEEEPSLNALKDLDETCDSSAPLLEDMSNKKEIRDGSTKYSSRNFLTHVKNSPQKFKDSLFGSISRTTEELNAKNKISESSTFAEPDISSSVSYLEFDECPASSRKHTYVQLKSLKTWKDIKLLSFTRKNRNPRVAPVEIPGELSYQERTADSMAHEINSRHGNLTNSYSFDACQTSRFQNNEQNFYPSGFQTSLKRYSLSSPFDRRREIPNSLEDTQGKSNLDSLAHQPTAKLSLLDQFTHSKLQAAEKFEKTTAGYYSAIYRNLLGTGKKSCSLRSNTNSDMCSPDEMYSFRRHSVSIASPEVAALREKRLTPSSLYPLTLSPFSPDTESDSLYDKKRLYRSVCHNSAAPKSFHRTWAQDWISSSARGADPPYFCTQATFPNRTANFENSYERERDGKSVCLLYSSK